LHKKTKNKEDIQDRMNIVGDADPDVSGRHDGADIGTNAQAQRVILNLIQDLRIDC
jgi:hypothetical protein